MISFDITMMVVLLTRETGDIEFHHGIYGLVRYRLHALIIVQSSAIFRLCKK